MQMYVPLFLRQFCFGDLFDQTCRKVYEKMMILGAENVELYCREGRVVFRDISFMKETCRDLTQRVEAGG